MRTIATFSLGFLTWRSLLDGITGPSDRDSPCMNLETQGTYWNGKREFQQSWRG